MKNRYTQKIRAFVFFFIMSLISFNSFAQVGIGTDNPNSNALLEINASTRAGGLLLPRVGLSSTSSFFPLTAHVEGMTVYNTDTTGDVRPGQYYNNGTRWIRIQGADPVESVSLTTNQTISNTTFTAIPGMTLQFTARKTSVLIVMTASGYGNDDAMSYVQLRVVKTSPGANFSIGGTNNKVQSYDWYYKVTSPQWSASFSKLYTGLVIGTTYTLRVEGLTSETYGTRNAYIRPVSYPNDNHLTLSVIQ